MEKTVEETPQVILINPCLLLRISNTGFIYFSKWGGESEKEKSEANKLYNLESSKYDMGNSVLRNLWDD